MQTVTARVTLLAGSMGMDWPCYSACGHVIAQFCGPNHVSLLTTPGVHMPSKARKALDENLKDVDALLNIHATKGGTAAGRRYGLEVLNKSAIVLITSYWEAYCEDIAEEGVECIVTHATTADALPTEIKKVVAKELKGDNNELAVWRI